MRVFTPAELIRKAENKYLGVLIAAKYARALNEFRRGGVDVDTTGLEKLTTTALGAVADGDLEWDLVDRRRGES